MNDKGLIICPISNIIGQLSSKLTPRPHIQIFFPSLWIKIRLHDLLCHQAAIQSNSAVVCASLQTKTTTVMCEFGRWLEQNIVCTRPNSPQKKTKRRKHLRRRSDGYLTRCDTKPTLIIRRPQVFFFQWRERLLEGQVVNILSLSVRLTWRRALQNPPVHRAPGPPAHSLPHLASAHKYLTLCSLMFDSCLLSQTSVRVTDNFTLIVLALMNKIKNNKCFVLLLV